jgi:hypothetical protein
LGSVVCKGPAKKIGDPRGGWVRGQKRTRQPGSDLIFDIFYRVFPLPSPRNSQKRDIKIEKKSVWDFFVDFFVKLFDTIVLQNVFCSVFELPSLRNTRKRDKTKEVENKLTSNFLSVFGESFRHGLFAKNICMVFLNSPHRET